MSSETLDLTDCDKERIHEIMAVQGHGAFVAVSPLDLKIHFASENLPGLFHHEEDVHFFLGKKLQDLIPADVAHKIQERLRSGKITPGNPLRYTQYGAFPLDMFLYQLRDNLYGIEFEVFESRQAEDFPEELLNQYLNDVNSCKTVEELARRSCQAVRALTSFDRVMVYRFFPPFMYGEVIAEDRVADSHSFLRHRFPASDIPKQARDLYYRNQVRFIYDSHEKRSEVFPKTTGRLAPLDLSDSRLRAVSPIHIEYLKNMGVRGSFSVAIIVNDSLWGIISCHASNPVHISHFVRSQCQMVGRTLAFGVGMMENLQKEKEESRWFEKLHQLYNELKDDPTPQDQLMKKGERVLELFNCQGFALVSKDKVDTYGMTPARQDIRDVWQYAMKRLDDENRDVLNTNVLSSHKNVFETLKNQMSGLLAIRLSEMSDTLFMVMRPEYLETIQWGGDPQKNLVTKNFAGTINPRESFSTWSEVVRNHSLPWTEVEAEGISWFRNLIFTTLVQKEQILGELHEKLQKLRTN